MTKAEFALKVQKIVQVQTGRSITVAGVKTRLDRHLPKLRAALRARPSGYEEAIRTSWGSMTDERKSKLVDEVAQNIITSDPRYRENRWSIPSIDQEGLNGNETYQALEGYLERSDEFQVELVGEVKLLSRQALFRRLIKLSEIEPGIVTYDRSSKVGVIRDLDAVMPELIAMNNVNCLCSLYLHRFTDGPWAGHFYVGITAMLPRYRTKLHLIDAFRTNKDTGEYRRYHRFAQAIRETAAIRGDDTLTLFDTEILMGDLYSDEASQREAELIEQFKQTHANLLLNQVPGGSIGGRHGTRLVILDGKRMFLSEAIRQFCVEEGIDDEFRLAANLKQYCRQHPQYLSDTPIELRPLLEKAAHIIQTGTKAYSYAAYRYRYQNKLLCLREIADITGHSIARLNSLRARHKFKRGAVIDDYVDGNRTAGGSCAAGDCEPYYEYLKSRNPRLAQEWVTQTSRRKVSWGGLGKVLGKPASSIRYAANASTGEVSKFWASLGVRLDSE